MNELITIGELARRSGVAASALRFYEARGLISSVGEAGKTRRYRRDAIRRVSFIRVAQAMGMSLQDIGAALAELPSQRTPTADDWAKISQAWRHQLALLASAKALNCAAGPPMKVGLPKMMALASCSSSTKAWIG